jgi:hypothetical protein
MVNAMSKLSLIVLLGLAVTMGVTSRTAFARDGLRGDERAIYALLVNEVYLGDLHQIGWKEKPDDRLVLVAEPATPGEQFEIANALEQLGAATDTAQSFLTARTNSLLDERLACSMPYTLIHERDLRALFANPDLSASWREFGARYSGAPGFVAMSGIGFNEARSEAIVFITYSCASLCGKGLYIRLSKEKGVWTVASQHMAWIS